MKKTNYRDVRSTPPRIGKLSELENDLKLLTTEEVDKKLKDLEVVTSVNGNTGSVVLEIPVVRRTETYLGVTNANGDFSVIYTTPFTSVPDVQPQLQSGKSSQVARITNSTVNGFTVNVTERMSANLLATEVLLATTVPVSGASVSVLVTSR